MCVYHEHEFQQGWKKKLSTSNSLMVKNEKQNKQKKTWWFTLSMCEDQDQDLFGKSAETWSLFYLFYKTISYIF